MSDTQNIHTPQKKKGNIPNQHVNFQDNSEMVFGRRKHYTATNTNKNKGAQKKQQRQTNKHQTTTAACDD